MDRNTEMMICMKEQGYSIESERFGGCIGFPLECMVDMWDILQDEEYESSQLNSKGCHKCCYSFRGSDRVLHCKIGGTTMVTQEQPCFKPKTKIEKSKRGWGKTYGYPTSSD